MCVNEPPMLMLCVPFSQFKVSSIEIVGFSRPCVLRPGCGFDRAVPKPLRVEPTPLYDTRKGPVLASDALVYAPAVISGKKVTNELVYPPSTSLTRFELSVERRLTAQVLRMES